MNLDTPLLRKALVVAIVLLHVALVVAPLDVLYPVDPWRIGRWSLQGHLPYRDFGFEYPPLAALAFLLPGLVPHGVAPSVLALQALVLEGLVVWFVLRPLGSDVLWRYALLSLLLFPFLSGGFDALPMAAIAFATMLLVRDDARGWWVAAAGTVAKVSPAGAWAWARTRPRVGVVALVVTAVVALSPLLLADKADDTYLGYTLHRGVQVESIPASLTWAGKKLTGGDVSFAYRFRSWEIDGADGAATAVVILGALTLGALALLAGRPPGRFRERPATTIVGGRSQNGGARGGWTASLVATVVLVCASKVLSPQFVAWGAPVAAVVGGRTYRLYLVAAALTFAAYAVGGNSDGFLLLALLRNAVLVGVVVAGFRELLQPRPAPVDLGPQVVE